jgi:hypothetical protein
MKRFLTAEKTGSNRWFVANPLFRNGLRTAGLRSCHDQPTVQGRMCPLDPPFHLARIGAEDLDVELMQQGPTELGHAIAARGFVALTWKGHDELRLSG